MRTLRLGLYFLAGILIAGVAIETALRFFPVTRGLFRTLEASRWPLYANTAHTGYTYSMTWDFQRANTGRTNNYGHLAPFDFVKNSRPVLVLGDSFIEAQALRYQDTLQGQLARFAGAVVPVYGMGFAGNSIAEYLAIAGLTKDEFKPRAAVVLMIDGDISEAIGAARLHYYFDFKDGQPSLQYQPSGGASTARRIRESIGDSALYRYVYSNLRFSPDQVLRSLNTPSDGNGDGDKKGPNDLSRSQAVVDVFLGEFSARSGIPVQCTVFLFDTDRADIYDKSHQRAAGKDTDELTAYFAARARRAGYQVVELRPLFVSHYGRYQQRFDFSPLDNHWNWLGHKLAAEAAHAALSQAASCL